MLWVVKPFQPPGWVTDRLLAELTAPTIRSVAFDVVTLAVTELEAVPLALPVASTALDDATFVMTSADIPQESAPVGCVTVIVSPDASADVTGALKTTTR
jgi:hypothetical protein